MRAWAVEQLARGILGRDAIAFVCGIPARTVGSWARAEIHRTPSLMSTHREYERALGILLYEKFPHQRSYAAEIVNATPRMIQEWRMQVHSLRFQGEFHWATRLAVVVLNPQIPKYFKVNNGQVVQTLSKLPDSLELEDLIWQVYDDILLQMLRRSHEVRYRQRSSGSKNLDILLEIGDYASQTPPSSIPTLKRLNGPHSHRGAIIFSDGYKNFDPSTDYQRKTYGNIRSHPLTLANHSGIQVAQGELVETLESLSVTTSRATKYQFRFGKNRVKWNKHEALISYLIKVHPKYKTIARAN